MPESVQNYVSQNSLGVQKRQALYVWSVAFAVALLWVIAIISAPFFEAQGLKSISKPIYGFFGYMCHQISARSYHYHEYQFAVCARCFGFYAGFASGFIIYPLIRTLNNTDSFPRFWLFAAMIPMGIDVGLEFLGIWHNTHLSRTITGLILGIACALFIIPALVEISFFIRGRFRKT